MNDQAVIGGVRALEGNGIKFEDIIGIGIGGMAESMNEFNKSGGTGFYGTIILSAKKHGYQSALAMYDWITKGIKPKLLTYTTGVFATKDNVNKILTNLGLK